jgi:hypothetical protein
VPETALGAAWEVRILASFANSIAILAVSSRHFCLTCASSNPSNPISPQAQLRGTSPGIAVDRATLESEGELYRHPKHYEFGWSIRPRMEKNLQGLRKTVEGFRANLQLWKERQEENPDEWFLD